MTYQEIATHINKKCIKANCMMCAEADRYKSYQECPYLNLKQIARDRLVTADDVKKSMEESEMM